MRNPLPRSRNPARACTCLHIYLHVLVTDIIRQMLSAFIASVLFVLSVDFDFTITCYGRPMEYGRPLYFCALVSSSIFFLLLFLAYSEPTGIECLPYFHTWCGLSANLGCRSEMYCTRLVKIQDAKNLQNSPSAHHRTILLHYIFATKARIDNQKKLVKQQYLHYMFSQYGELGPLAAEIGSLVWGTSANFNGLRVLAALLHGTLVVGVSQTLRR